MRASIPYTGVAISPIPLHPSRSSSILVFILHLARAHEPAKPSFFFFNLSCAISSGFSIPSWRSRLCTTPLTLENPSPSSLWSRRLRRLTPVVGSSSLLLPNPQTKEQIQMQMILVSPSRLRSGFNQKLV